MFHHVTGTLTSKAPGEAVIEAGGVGYLLKIPASTYDALPALGRRATLLAHLHVTDDALTLFGFATEGERAFFKQLIAHVSGVGPKLAMAVLGRGHVAHLQQAIRIGNFAALKGGGVGEATAKRIVLELGKILVKQAELDAGAPATAKRPGKPAAVEAPAIQGLDEMTELAVKAVVQLNEVPSDVALRAVQRAYDAMRAEKQEPTAVQDLIRRALSFSE
ncbi:MAG: Holliday junction branch migration protein RuvA [Planctomycetota bacterium]|nr:Holliday junction branch migration protein RuvA [Planctomycetota bacterium]